MADTVDRLHTLFITLGCKLKCELELVRNRGSSTRAESNSTVRVTVFAIDAGDV